MFNSWLDPWGLKKLEKLLNKQRGLHFPVVILTGAGISQESGIPTFRGNDGLWKNHSIKEIATPDGLAKNRELLLEFYNHRRRELLDEAIKPNEAHLALAKLEDYIGEVSIITQNVDNLHERAGSQLVTHIHGRLLKNKCNKCNYSWDSTEEISLDQECPVCSAKAVRPDIVFFKEAPYSMECAYLDLNHAKIFIAIGTSGVVYPAAHFVHQARQQGAICIEINPNPSATSGYFDITIKKPASEAVPKLVDYLISRF